eukprot:5303188-Amphidinium_carterae.2
MDGNEPKIETLAELVDRCESFSSGAERRSARHPSCACRGQRNALPAATAQNPLVVLSALCSSSFMRVSLGIPKRLVNLGKQTDGTYIAHILRSSVDFALKAPTAKLPLGRLKPANLPSDKHKQPTSAGQHLSAKGEP